ncbi:DUF3237 domain-containing protein [Parahaliea mediterranea]|uniref:DUF3237 domain-containing protein n=1 Tax=Parahaliea mediterranea TaxID=651086 RepID=UPI000E2FDD2A|nr:DUF3237 domain-containing protein [Parahaliea mediterranea]
MFEFEMDHLFSYHAILQSPPEVIGPVAEGLRLNYYVTGGEVSGPRVRGKVRPVGADWLTIRTDGVGILDVRATIETHDQALIYIAYQGVADFGENGYKAALDGDLPATVGLRCAPRLQSSHPDYLWVNRIQCVLVGESDVVNSIVSYDGYALR